MPDDPAEQADVESTDSVPVSFFPTDESGTLWLFRPDASEVTLVGIVMAGDLSGTVPLASGEHASPQWRGGLVIESGDSTLREYRTLSTEGAMTPLWDRLRPGRCRRGHDRRGHLRIQGRLQVDRHEPNQR